MADADDDFVLRPLASHDTLKGLKSGDAAFAPLTAFARNKAQKYEAANLARTYVIDDQSTGRTVAYVTLVCSEVRSVDPQLQPENLEFPYDHYPAVKIARLLVDKRYRGENRRGLGKTLVDFALGIARSEICPAVGCRFVVVEAKSQSVGFYEARGFTTIDTPTNRELPAPVMYLDLHKASA